MCVSLDRQEFFVDPVIASDGHTYEKKALGMLFARATASAPALSPFVRASVLALLALP